MTGTATPARNDLAAVQDALLARLKDRIDGIEIDAFPDRPDQYVLRHRTGALLLAYAGSKYGQLQATDLVVQDRTISFDLNVQARSLNGGDGAVALLEAARLALTGWRVPGGGKVYPVEDRFLAQGEGVWHYVLTVAVPAVAIEDFDAGEDQGGGFNAEN